jgi:outer membrane usher protein
MAGGNRSKGLAWRRVALLFPASALPHYTLAAQDLAQPTNAPVPVTAPEVSAETVPPDINPTNNTIVLAVPLRDQFPRGQVGILITPDDQVLVSTSDIIAALESITTTAFQATLKGVATTDGYAPLAAVQSTGLAISFDPGNLELVLDLAAESMLANTINLGLANPQNIIQPDNSSPFALALTYQASLDYVHEGLVTGLESPRVDFTFDGRIANLFAFENEFTYDGEATESKFYRSGSRVILDRPLSALRFTAGDQIPTSASFQGAIDIAGIGAARLLETFRPDRTLASTSSQSITLREGANVTVVVNGVPARTIRLERGVFNLSDLPLTQGANAVQLIIEDDAGGRRVVDFDFFEDFRLLAPGVDEFDLQAGIRSDIDQSGRQYFTSEPVFSGFYRRGLTPQLTAGINVQATKDVQQAGIEATLGTAIGLFTFEGAASQANGAGFGHAQRIQYRFSSPLQQSRGVRRLDISAEHRSRDFSTATSIGIVNAISWRLSARYSQPVSEAITAAIGADYSKFRAGGRDRYGLSASATWAVGPRTSVSLSAGYDDQQEAFFGVNFNHRFGYSSSVSGRYDSRQDQANLSYNYSPLKSLDVVAINADIQRTPDDIGFNGTATYRSNRGDLALAHRTTYSTNTDDISQQTTSLRARGAIAFAGGNIAIGRYLTDAFAIVDAHESLGSTTVSAPVVVGDRLAGREIARTGTFGPALVPLSSYNKQALPVEVPDAPTGYDLGPGNFEVYPWLNSGYYYVVGSEFNITVIGQIQDFEGAPLSLVAGTATRQNDPDSPTVEVFSNRAGKFAASGMAPGVWTIVFPDGNNYQVEISDKQGSFIDLGTIRPLAAGAPSR